MFLQLIGLGYELANVTLSAAGLHSATKFLNIFLGSTRVPQDTNFISPEHQLGFS